MSGKQNRIHPLGQIDSKPPDQNTLYSRRSLGSHTGKAHVVYPSRVNSSHQERFHRTQPLAERKKLLSGNTKRVSGCAACKLGIKRRWHKFKAACNEIIYKLHLFQGSFKRIEGYQGSGVLTYFIFLKWLFKLNVVIFLLMFLFTTLPQVIFTERGLSSSVTGSSADTAAVNLSMTCSANYTVTVSNQAADVLQDFLQGTGWMEKTVLFFGAYSNQDLFIASTSDYQFSYNMPLAFLTVTAVCFLISLILMAIDIAEVYKRRASHERGLHTSIIAGWDFTLLDYQGALYRKRSIYYEILADIDEARLLKEKTELSSCSKCRLYTIRALVNFIIIAILGGAIYLIYFVSDFSTTYIKSSAYASADSFVQLLVEFLPSLTLTALNSVCPIVFVILIKLEKYSPAFQIKLTLLRTVFLKMVSLGVIVAQLYIEITCEPEDSCGVGTGSCVALKCWETYTGQQFYKLIITDFFVAILMTFLVEFPRKMIVSKCNCCLSNLIGLQEFDIPKNVLDLVYSQMLIWIGFFFSPIIPAMCVLKLFITFYLKKFSALVNCMPPKRPFKASRANTFFMVILMFAYFLSAVPVIGSIVSIDPSKGCGPFRIYDDMFDIYGVTFSAWPSWLQAAINFLSSAAFVLPFVFVLGLGIYYFFVVSRANMDMVKLLKEQLTTESIEKQYLIRQLSGKNTPKEKTYQRQPPSEKPSSRPDTEISNNPVSAEDTWA